jgi:sigma-B regulation protein RsbU (phosphoserine phosphatase)
VRPRRRILDLIWRPAVFAVPFAMFFGLLFSPGGWDGYRGAYLVSLVFAYTISISLELFGRFVYPRLTILRKGEHERDVVFDVLVHTCVATMGSFLGAAIIHFTILPGFLGSPRQFLIVGTFGLLFSVLVGGMVAALVFYRRSLAKAKSEEELNLARRIQRSFLLSKFPAIPGLEVHAVNVSSRQVSGDFYDVEPAGEGAWLLAIADVSGKGVPAALLTSMLQASLRTQALSALPVSEIMANINRLVCRSAAPGQFATFFLARLEPSPMRVTCVNAGHNYPVVFRRNGDRELLVKGGLVVGMLEEAAFEEETFELRPGDRLVFYTDGVSEAERADREQFGEERLHALVQGLPPDLSAAEITERILAGVREFLAGREAGDDITLLVLRVLGPAAAADHRPAVNEPGPQQA